MVTEADIRLADGRTLHAYDTRPEWIAISSRHARTASARPAAELRIVPGAGHITMLDSAPEALTCLAARIRA